MKTILALDLATQMGYAGRMSDGFRFGGSVSFHVKGKESRSQRWLKFLAWLRDINRRSGGIDIIYFEEVVIRKGIGRDFTAVYYGMKAYLEAWCEQNNVRLESVNVSTIKKWWTGNGNANKDAMVTKVIESGFMPVDDNHADAHALLEYALQTMKGK